MTGQDFDRKLVLMGSAFAAGLATGLLMRGGAGGLLERVRLGNAHNEYERTITYDENLPESLGRREPAPHPGQPRYGGTGALGVSPASAADVRSR